MKSRFLFICLTSIVFALPVSADTIAKLASKDAASLQFMLEEEKLAYDVYSHLYTIYKDRPFANISSAEKRHQNAILDLMKHYGVEPRASSNPGKFNDPGLQSLYDKLIDLSESSREMAFVVGVIIEETDIADLSESIDNTDNADLLRVYENLRDGSYRHLNAFQSGLERVSKNPQAAHKKAVDAIK